MDPQQNKNNFGGEKKIKAKKKRLQNYCPDLVWKKVHAI